MKTTKNRLIQIVREEIQREAAMCSPRPDPNQGVEPSSVEMAEAVADLGKARDIVARSMPELLDELDYVIAKMQEAGVYPPENTQPYTVYEDNEEQNS